MKDVKTILKNMIGVTMSNYLFDVYILEIMNNILMHLNINVFHGFVRKYRKQLIYSLCKSFRLH